MSLDSPKGVVANDRRVALRFSLIPKGNFVPAGHTLRLGPYEHGIDMSLRPRKRGRRPHWLLAFTALFFKNGSPPDAPSDHNRLGPRFGATRPPSPMTDRPKAALRP